MIALKRPPAIRAAAALAMLPDIPSHASDTTDEILPITITG
jgi:hypothetical protein